MDLVIDGVREGVRVNEAVFVDVLVDVLVTDGVRVPVAEMVLVRVDVTEMVGVLEGVMEVDGEADAVTLGLADAEHAFCLGGAVTVAGNVRQLPVTSTVSVWVDGVMSSATSQAGAGPPYRLFVSSTDCRVGPSSCGNPPVSTLYRALNFVREGNVEIVLGSDVRRLLSRLMALRNNEHHNNVIDNNGAAADKRGPRERE